MASNNNIQAAQQTYHGFLNLMKYGSIGVILLAALVIVLIA